MAKGYIGWKIPDSVRGRLLGLIPAAYPRVFAHHITHRFGVDENEPLPSATKALITAVADDGKGCQAIAIVFGDVLEEYVFERPDGNHYHCTWSLSADRKPVDSNKVIMNTPMVAFDNPIEVDIVPTFFPF